jgi:hypothetical protein
LGQVRWGQVRWGQVRWGQVRCEEEVLHRHLEEVLEEDPLQWLE